MDKRFKQRISRMLRSSFGSCRSKHITDVIETTALPAPDEQHHHQLISLVSPKPRPFPSSNRKPKWAESSQRRSLSEREALLLSPPPAPCPEGQKCPPASPISPLNSFHDSHNLLPKNTVKRSKRANAKKVRRSRTRSFGMNEFPACSYNGLFSSDEDDDDNDKTTFFSSRSISSESSQSFRQDCRSSKAFKGILMEEGKEFETTSGRASPPERRVENNSFAVVKRSSDPYNDFKTSMVEMIIVKQIFEAKDLDNLLQCFLSLNSSRHHRVIVQVFNEIWEALFSSGS